MRYIDFDGVILDTEDILFYEWKKNPNRYELSEDAKIDYIKKQDWKSVLRISPVINDSIYILKHSDINNYSILTKVHSLYEGSEKIKYLRSCGVKQKIILVANDLKKVDVVPAKNNILVDDSLKNLSEWEKCGGYPMFFDKKENNVDSWNVYNDKGYQRVLRINEKKTNNVI